MKHVLASTLYVALDGTAFALSSGGLVAVGLVTAAALLVESPSRFTRTVARSSALVIAGRISHSLLQLVRVRRRANDNTNDGRGPEDKIALSSIWDWEPPSDSEKAGLWFVLKELVQTFDTISLNYPEIKSMIDSTSDLPQRLWYYLVTDVDDIRAASEGAGQQQALSEEDERGLDLLREYREFCIFSYDCTTDQQLEERLSSRGFKLIGAKYASDELSPAFYLAANQAAKETVMCIRGTFSGNDVITDMVAAGTPFGDGGFAHKGMATAAQYLFERFGELLLSIADDRDGLVTVCGHSLGAGVAALLTNAITSKRSSSSSSSASSGRIRCLCYEPPACMSAPLAAKTVESTYSVVNRDDLVPRLGPTPIVNLLHNLAAFDWRAAAEKDGDAIVSRLTLLLATKDTKNQERRAGPGLQPNESWQYDPVVPGKVLFVNPGSAPTRIDPFSEVLRSLRLTPSCVRDHFVDTDEFSSALVPERSAV